MPEENRKSKWIYVRWFAIRFFLVVYDIIAVNAACYLALLTRFYVAKQFHSAAAQYIEAYTSYAPYYTILCLVIFCCFNLYSGIWKYAGFNDLNRIVAKPRRPHHRPEPYKNHFHRRGQDVSHHHWSAFIVQKGQGGIIGKETGNIRMPISFYCLSAFTQTCLITASRFSYRLLLMEKVRVANNGKGATINAMVIGAGGTGKIVLQELEREKTVRPVCALNYKEIGFGSLLDGVPVVNGVENLKGAIEKYRVNFVIIASAVMPQEVRNRIKAICREASVEVQDYSGFFQGFGGSVTLKNLAECADGKVELVVNGEHQQYADCEQALVNAAGKYVVKSISARADTLVIELTDHSVVQNDLNADWVKDQEKETGEAISFF